jgi:signal transduction histidine kinase
MEELAREAGASYEAVAEAKRIALHVHADDGLRVRADPKRILQVLFNLLGNAMKFTPEGGRIDVDAHTVDGHVEVSVKDTGPGLTQEQISRLFLPFSQVHDTEHTTFGGTGLGLYISRGIAEQHAGTLSCESAGPGQGSRFTFALPCT